MLTGKDTHTIELLYKAFQENPNRLTYSTEKLQKQYNASQSQVQKARKLYRINPKDYVVAQAISLGSDFDLQDSIPASELFEILTGEDIKKYYTIGVDPYEEDKSMTEILTDLDEEDEWEVKHKWVKTGDQSSFMVRKRSDLKKVGEKIIEQMENYSPVYPVIKREQPKDPHLLVLSLADIHLGKLSVTYETGQEYNRQIAINRTLEGIQGLLNKSAGFNIDGILLIVGNDILHTDTLNRSTTKGTPQDTEGMWHENFLLAKDLYIKVIEMLVPIADVYVQHNMSNHDYMSGYFLADTVKSWFRLNENVVFDTSPKDRKYFQYGLNLIGSTHGDNIKPDNLPLIMAEENPQEWGETKFRFWYTHHIHSKQSKDYGSVCVESLRSPSVPDAWHDRSGYLNTQALEGFIHSFDRGQVARLTNYF